MDELPLEFVSWMTTRLLDDLGGKMEGQVGFDEDESGDGVFRGSRLSLPTGWDRLPAGVD